MDRSGKESFLAKFWENHNLIILKYYYGFYLGNRYFSVLDAYFERGHLIRDIYASRAEEQDAKLIESAHNILSRGNCKPRGSRQPLRMCHLARIGKDWVDMDHYIGKVVDRDSGHYDARFKLGVIYESLPDLDRAVAAYSRQLEVTPCNKPAPERLARVATLRRAKGKSTYSS